MPILDYKEMWNFERINKIVGTVSKRKQQHSHVDVLVSAFAHLMRLMRLMRVS